MNIFRYTDQQFTGEKSSVQFHLTVDDELHYVKYNDGILQVFGDLSDWRSIKSISFESLNDNPGTLEIKGEDKTSSGNNCHTGGLLLHCRSNDTMSPWHNFVSDNSSDWKDGFNFTPCKRNSGIMDAAYVTAYFFKSLSVNKIWADRPIATLTVTPRIGNANFILIDD